LPTRVWCPKCQSTKVGVWFDEWANCRGCGWVDEREVFEHDVPS